MITDEERRSLMETREELERFIQKINFILERNSGECTEAKKETCSIVSGYEEQYVSRYLIKIGVPITMKGFKYITAALKLIMENPKEDIFVTKEIYPQIAKKYNTKWNNVERLIRGAIETTWKRGNKEALTRLFGDSYKTCRPSNAMFLLRIIEDMQQKY